MAKRSTGGHRLQDDRIRDTLESTAVEPGADTPRARDEAERTDEASDAQAERDRYYDLLLRKTAEFENYRKRVERERREMAESAAVDLIQELLPIIDDLERALYSDVTDESVEPYRKGVEIIHKQLIDLLRKRGVTPIDALGADFDPHFHQAVIHEASPGHRDGEVTEEFRRGYMLGDRLLRAAMVKVAKS
jgi:molecular chaperone GrpE